MYCLSIYIILHIKHCHDQHKDLKLPVLYHQLVIIQLNYYFFSFLSAGFYFSFIWCELIKILHTFRTGSLLALLWNILQRIYMNKLRWNIGKSSMFPCFDGIILEFGSEDYLDFGSWTCQLVRFLFCIVVSFNHWSHTVKNSTNVRYAPFYNGVLQRKYVRISIYLCVYPT